MDAKRIAGDFVTRDGDQYSACSAGEQGSNIVSALTRANALLIIPPQTWPK